MQCAFILLDVAVLFIALIQINKVLKKQPQLRTNERYMALHIVMLCFLLVSIFLVVFSALARKYIIIFNSVFFVCDLATVAIMIFIMILVKRDG